jgi:predicted GIY-YIG superfamily endonuclease
VKDNLGIKTPDVYSVPCEHSQDYVGQTGHYVETRLKEHQWHINLEHPDKSDMAKHSMSSAIKYHSRTAASYPLNPDTWTG